MRGFCSLCHRYLNLFRGIIPPLGGTIDLSPILAFITLDVSSPHILLPSLLRASIVHLWRHLNETVHGCYKCQSSVSVIAGIEQGPATKRPEQSAMKHEYARYGGGCRVAAGPYDDLFVCHTLQVFTNSAQALPCELGPDGKMVQPKSQQQAWTPAKSLVAWRQRLSAQRRQQQVG